MSNDVSDEALAFLADEIQRMSDRGLGDLQLKSNLFNSGQGLVVSRSAANLITKAQRAWAVGDRERADRFIDRALQLPFDEAAEADAALQAAHMLLYTTVRTAVEDSDPRDPCWLDAAEAALDHCGPDAREDLLETLRVIAQDHTLERDEMRRIRRIAPGHGLVRGIGDVMLTRSGADKPTVRRIVVDLLEAVGAVQAELAARRGETPRG